jgi:hypothetical protein
VRTDLAQSLIARQLLSPVSRRGRRPARSAVSRYAAMLKEREGEIAFLPSLLFAPQGQAVRRRFATSTRPMRPAISSPSAARSAMP